MAGQDAPPQLQELFLIPTFLEKLLERTDEKPQLWGLASSCSELRDLVGTGLGPSGTPQLLNQLPILQSLKQFAVSWSVTTLAAAHDEVRVMPCQRQSSGTTCLHVRTETSRQTDGDIFLCLL